MSTYLKLHYSVTFGTGDGSDCFEWEEALEDDEEAAYLDAIRNKLELNSIEALQPAVDRAYADIEAQEIDNFLDCDDPYVMECQGIYEVDPDTINELVAEKDPHAIEYFELQNLSDEELAKWDARNLDELPQVRDFDQDFEPYSPFDQGWTLNVEIDEPDYEDEDEEE